MKKYTLKQIKNFIAEGIAEDITNYSFEAVNTLRKENRLEKIGYSSGVYGINGGLLQDTESGKLYAIDARNATLMQLF